MNIGKFVISFNGVLSSVLKDRVSVLKPAVQNARLAYTNTFRGPNLRPGKHRGWKKMEGEYVEKGMILYRQLGLKCYPGENVGCGKDLTLFALEAGRVMVTWERLSPYPHSPLFPAVKAGRVFYKQFYHVLPQPQHSRFKLVSQT